MLQPINISYDISITPPHGRFGFPRKHDVHTGFDLYCSDGEPVYAMEDGIVTDVSHFTGEFTTPIPMPWWENTMAIAIEGKSGVILYGEIYEPILKIGDKVVEGQIIANVKRVLRKDKGLPMSMLHIELYNHGYRGDWSVWNLENENTEIKVAGKPPVDLLNIETILTKVYVGI